MAPLSPELSAAPTPPSSSKAALLAHCETPQAQAVVGSTSLTFAYSGVELPQHHHVFILTGAARLPVVWAVRRELLLHPGGPSLRGPRRGIPLGDLDEVLALTLTLILTTLTMHLTRCFRRVGECTATRKTRKDTGGVQMCMHMLHVHVGGFEKSKA